MNKIQFLIGFFVFSLIIFSSCNKEEPEFSGLEEVHNAIAKFTSVQDIKSLDIDKKYNLSKDSYEGFLNSLIFNDNQLKGFYYGEIETLLDDDQLQNFWMNFGISPEMHSEIDSRSNYELQGFAQKECTLMNAKPIPRGCEPAGGWACFYPC